MSCEFKASTQATIRGVPFHIDTGQESGGHRKIDHAFPNRDEHFIEDLGLTLDGFNVKGYVHGDDLPEQVRGVRGALKGKGECSFYHPLIDEMFTVEIMTWNIDTKYDAQGKANFSFTAKKVEAGAGGGGGLKWHHLFLNSPVRQQWTVWSER